MQGVQQQRRAAPRGDADRYELRLFEHENRFNLLSSFPVF
jgi:hypothetical protein